MVTIQLNDNQIELKPQENQPFLHLANNIMPGLTAGEPIAKLCCQVVAEGMKQNVPQDHPLFQSALWMLHQVGVRSMSVNMEAGEVKITQSDKNDLDGQPFEEHFTLGNASTGRAMVATLLHVCSRSVRVNGQEWHVKPQPIETMKRVNQEVLQSRQFGEELHITAMRRLLALLVGGKTNDDADVLASLQVVADLNVRGFSYTPDGSQVSLEAFSEPNALAMAYLHNMPPDQAKSLTERVRKLNERCKQGGKQTPETAKSVKPRRRG